MISLKAFDPTMASNRKIAGIESAIYLLRGQRVMLDSDLAAIYRVTTKRLNEQLKRNRNRFPDDFAFQLTTEEFRNSKSQIATSSLMSQFVTSSGHGGRRKLPWAFTEHGALMAANVLRSDRAIQMSVFVIRTFVRMREQVAANATILKRLAEIDKSLLQHDSVLRDIYRKLAPLLQPPPDPPKRRIGFISDDK